MEPALGIRLVCIVPSSLLVILGTAETLNIPRYPVLFSLVVRSICALLFLHSSFLDSQYARRYRGVVAIHLFVVQNLLLWKDSPVTARLLLGGFVLAVLWWYLPRERLRLMLFRVL